MEDTNFVAGTSRFLRGAMMRNEVVQPYDPDFLEVAGFLPIYCVWDFNMSSIEDLSGIVLIPVRRDLNT